MLTAAEIAAQQGYQESPVRQALVKQAKYNIFLGAMTIAVKALAELEGDYQQFAWETLGRLLRMEKGIVDPAMKPWRD